jgi:hypothetical protein
MPMLEKIGAYLGSRSKVDENWSQIEMSEMPKSDGHCTIAIGNAAKGTNYRQIRHLKWQTNITRRYQLENRLLMQHLNNKTPNLHVWLSSQHKLYPMF